MTADLARNCNCIRCNTRSLLALGGAQQDDGEACRTNSAMGPMATPVKEDAGSLGSDLATESVVETAWLARSL
jgi:hypothetical protein